MDVDRECTELFLEQGVQIVPGIVNSDLGPERDIPMRSIDEVTRSLAFRPGWAELVRDRSNHLHTLTSNPLIPFLNKRKVKVVVEINRFSIFVL